MQLTPEQINDFIAKAVLESQIGQATAEAVTRAVADLSKTYNNPFDAAIKNEVAILIQTHVREAWRPHLEERVKAAMATALTDEAIEAIVSAAVKKLTGRDY